MSHITVYVINTYARGVSIILISFLLLTFAIYSYLLQGVIVYSATVERGEQNFSEMTSEIGDLERSYLSIKSGITLDEALKRGFVKSEEPRYLSLQRTEAKLSLNSGE